MRTIAMGLAMTLGVVACRREAPSPAASVPVERPDAGPPVDAGRAAALGVVPVVTLDGQAYVPVEGWLLAEIDAPAVGPIRTVEETLKLQAVDGKAPAARALVGAPITTYAADGAACRTTITALTWLGHGSFADELSDSQSYLLGQLAPTPGCVPVLATDRAGPDFFAPQPAPGPAVTAALVAAFRALPAYRDGAEANEWGDPPAIALYRSPTGGTRAIASLDTLELGDDCQDHGGTLLAIFALDAGAPALLATTDEPLGADLRAVVDTDRDGTPELILGPTGGDHGMTITRSLARAWPAAPPVPAADLAFSYYGGCD